MKNLFILLWICPILLFSQNKDSLKAFKSNHSYLRMESENDKYKLRGSTDRYFSNGITLEYQFPEEFVRGHRVQSWFPTLPDKEWRKSKLFMAVGVRMYTPVDVSITTVDSTDRPYAGWAYIGLGSVSSKFSKSERLTTLYSVGVIGPAAAQKWGQRAWHRLINENDPKGWDNQIANDIALNVHYLYEKRIFYPTERLETIGLMEVNAGTVTNFIGVGGQTRLGIFNDFFYNSSGLKMKNKVYSEKRLKKTPFPQNLNRKFQIYFTARTSFRFALDNSTLEGGIFSYKRSRYVLTSDQITRFYLNSKFGLTMVLNKFSISYSQLYRTKEFINGNATHWGSIKLVFGLGG